MSALTADLLVPEIPLDRRPGLTLLRAVLRMRRAQIGLAIVALMLGIALLGPLFAPHSPTAFVGPPDSTPSSTALLGTDQLGRDVFSRFLYGGWTVFWIAAVATAFGIVSGTIVGLTAAYIRGWVDEVLMRLMDVLLAFPPLVLALLAVSAIGPKLWLLLVVITICNMPYTARLVRGAAREVFERDFVKAAEAAGESALRIMFAEGLPNVISVVMVETGLRMTYSIAIAASVSFLGFGIQPPTADWGLMINENRLALTVQPWGVVAPALAIALLTIGFNLVTDAVARATAGVDR
jgi:peptide/nickel transport system permease protein